MMLEPNLYIVLGNQIKLFQGWVILGEGVVIDISGLEKVRRASG